MSQIDQAFIKAYQQQRGAAKTNATSPGTAFSQQTLPGGSNVRVDGAHVSDVAAAPAAKSHVPTPHLQMTAEMARKLANDARSQKLSQNLAATAKVQNSTSVAVPNASPSWSTSFRAGRRFNVAPVAAPADSPQPPTGHTEEKTASTYVSVEETLMRLVGMGGEEAVVVETPVELKLNGQAESSQVDAAAQPEAASCDAVPQEALVDTDASEPACEVAPQSEEPQVKVQPATVAEQPPETDPPVEKPVATQEPIAPESTSLPQEETKAEPVEENAAINEAVETAEVDTEQETTDESPAIETATLQAAWEVDGFQWPDVVTQLQADPIAGIEAACHTLRDSVASGSKLLAISGVEAGTGATTLSLLLARGLAKLGLNVALVDADFDKPQLTESLGIRVQDGWEAVIDGCLPLEEVCVASIGDGVTLVPAVQKSDAGSTKSSLGAAGVLKRIADSFDIVLIDAGSGSENVAAVATSSDEVLDVSVLLAVDNRRHNASLTNEIVTHLKQFSLGSVQIAQTFVTV